MYSEAVPVPQSQVLPGPNYFVTGNHCFSSNYLIGTIILYILKTIYFFDFIHLMRAGEYLYNNRTKLVQAAKHPQQM